ncbi:hypothetical protein KIPB_014605, partial [Kipferlia bialata]
PHVPHSLCVTCTTLGGSPPGIGMVGCLCYHHSQGHSTLETQNRDCCISVAKTVGNRCRPKTCALATYPVV